MRERPCWKEVNYDPGAVVPLWLPPLAAILNGPSEDSAETELEYLVFHITSLGISCEMGIHYFHARSPYFSRRDGPRGRNFRAIPNMLIDALIGLEQAVQFLAFSSLVQCSTRVGQGDGESEPLNETGIAGQDRE